MGQKVHPIGFRLGISKMHLSQWFAQKEDYSTYLLEDNFLRKTLQKRYKQIEKIEIFRKIKDHLEIRISLENTNALIGKRGRNLLKFYQEIKQILQTYRRKISANENIKVKLYVRNDPKSQPSASFIATFIKNLLEKRTSYRRALNLVFKKKLNYHKARFKGVKVQISGRLNGAEIARREWVREGALPLQTLNANVDYIYKQARTIYGILGIKVWVFYK
uniref:Small ribosomal subunit protein uS3c n=1 Tax=Chlorodesmis fastigiata TaxID=189431 RepID=A0A2P0QHE0_CHLFS|nr:ribosomal protein S3 [Chlorodesmis fastigiata]ARO74190.1 ribosomal protein S3 [Chlorodesmis fastigiata]